MRIRIGKSKIRHAYFPYKTLCGKVRTNIEQDYRCVTCKVCKRIVKRRIIELLEELGQ